MRNRSFIIFLVFVFGTTPFVMGDWDEGDGHKMHYPQLPKVGGFDVAFNQGRLADDWKCNVKAHKAVPWRTFISGFRGRTTRFSQSAALPFVSGRMTPADPAAIVSRMCFSGNATSTRASLPFVICRMTCRAGSTRFQVIGQPSTIICGSR